MFNRRWRQRCADLQTQVNTLEQEKQPVPMNKVAALPWLLMKFGHWRNEPMVLLKQSACW